ncbi:MAG: metal-dependent transcriptional regulator [Kiritimatiellae bacterium]|nr:metal-dependent transcriptional regulator [Kiritimatiellia bacterium]
MPITKSLEDYLEAIHCLIQETGSAHVAEIAKNVGVKMPSVNNAVKELAKLGLASYEKYHSVTLTDAGQAAAISIYERHQMLTKFLIQIGVPEENADEDACAMEHILSTTTIDCIKKFVAKQ